MYGSVITSPREHRSRCVCSRQRITAKQGATTVWEEYECYGEDCKPLPHSMNHYSPGAVCGFLFDTVCGIKLAGENRVEICPRPGGTLTHAEAHTLTACGEVVSEWAKQEGKIDYHLVIPANVIAEVCLPDGRRMTLQAGDYHF